jgi:hypothetical protein
MTFKNLQDDVLDRLNLTSTDARTRIKRHLNERYRRLASTLGMTSVRDSTTTQTTATGTAEYAITAQKIKHIYDATNATYLPETSLADLRQRDPGLDSSGLPQVWAPRKQTATAITIRLWPIPDTAYTLNLDISSALTELSGDSDVPTLIPDDWQWLIGLGARLEEYEKRDDARYMALSREYEQGVKDLRYFLRKSNSRTNTGDPAQPSSRLGPWYTE